MLAGTTRLGLYGGPARPYLGFVAKTVTELVTALHVDLSASHPLSLSAAGTTTWSLTGSASHPYDLDLTGG